MTQAFGNGFFGRTFCLFLQGSLILNMKCKSIKRGCYFCKFSFGSSGLQQWKAAAGKFESSFSTL